jgi:hypothetical protein
MRSRSREIAEDLLEDVRAVRRRAAEHAEPEVLQHGEVRQHPALLGIHAIPRRAIS